jgi:uncharacterized protein with GYD domain
MSLYLGRGQLSQEAIMGYISKPEDRTESIRALYEACGMKLLHLWATPAFELISIAEGDTLKNATHGSVALSMGAVTEVSWTELTTMEQLAEAMQRAGAVAGKYRPPGK